MWVVAQYLGGQREWVFDTDAARTERTFGELEQTTTGRIVQIHRVHIGKHEGDPAERIGGTSLLAQEVGESAAATAPVDGRRIDGLAVEIDELELLGSEEVRIGAQLGQDVFLEYGRRHRPARIQFHVRQLVLEDRCAAVGFADDHAA